MVRNVDDDMDELFDFSHAGQRPLEQSHDAQERSLDLDAEMSLEADMMGQHWGAGTHVHDDAFDDNDHIHDYDHNHDRAYNEGTNNTGLGLGQSLADEFGLDLDDELGGENTGVGGTLAGELGGLDDLADPQASYGYNNKNSHINSLQTSLTTSPDLADPQTPPNRYLALPDVSPAGYSYASHASSPGLSGVRSDTDTDADQPLFAQSHTSTRYYTGYSVSPNALPVVGQSASARKGKGKTSLTPSMLADGEAEMGGGSAAMLQEEEGRDEMRDLLEGKIRTAALNTAGQMQSLSHKVPAPRTPTAGPYAQHAPSRNTAPTFTPSRMVSGPQLQKDPMMVIQQCMADADRFLRALQRFNTPTTRPPDTSSPDIKGVTPQAAHSNLGTTGTMHVPEDEALADHLHKLTLRERKLDERQREMEKLAERWEEARYGEGQELDFTELRDAGVGDVVGLPGGSSGLNLAKPSALNRVKSMSFAPSPLSGNTSPSASTAVMTEMSIPSQLAPIISDPLQPTLSTLSETLHAQSSLLISTGRQLRAIRQAITTAQQGLKNEDRALRGIEEREAERVREGLRGGKRSDVLKGIGEGLEGVWEGQRARLEGLAFGSGLEGGRRGAGSALMG